VRSALSRGRPHRRIRGPKPHSIAANAAEGDFGLAETPNAPAVGRCRTRRSFFSASRVSVALGAQPNRQRTPPRLPSEHHPASTRRWQQANLIREVIGDIFQPTHLLLLLAVVLLVLGPKRLPEMARSLGRGFRDFKDAISGESHSMMHELDHQSFEPTPPAATRGSAQRPVTAPGPAADAVPAPVAAPVATPAHDPVAPTTLDSKAAPAPEPALATDPHPEQALATDPHPEPQLATEPHPEPQLATEPQPEPVATQTSEDPAEGAG
jgi:sec-independent protein translocase protein TatA